MSDVADNLVDTLIYHVREQIRLEAQLEVTNSLAFCPMEDAPRNRPLILRSPWGQVAVAKWDGNAWRYGPRPGETWDADYPDAWVPVHACGWID